MKTYLEPDFIIERDEDKCIKCQVCVRQCGFDCHTYDATYDEITSDSALCAGCHRCVTFCPTKALTIRRNPLEFRESANFTGEAIKDIYKQAETGGVLLTGMGNPLDYRIYWDHMTLNASQVTNPSIDPLREPMELKTFIGSKPDHIEVKSDRKGGYSLATKLSTQLELHVPVMFSAMSFGAVSLNTQKSLAAAAEKYGTFWNTGEGGLHRDLYKYGAHTIVQVASGRFGVDPAYLRAGAAVEIKIGQGAKPGLGGHLPGEKVGAEVSVTRMIPEGSDALSPYPHHDIYSIEDLRQLIYALKEAVRYEKPVGVKIAAVHNSAAIASGIVRAGADFVTMDGLRGSTGAAPKRMRDHIGIPIEVALAAVDTRLREEGIRNQASLIVAGGFRNSADVMKAIALGADAVYIGTAALVSLGCHVCQKCYTGICNWGIATQEPDLARRLNPEIGAERAGNLLRAWSHEMKEMLGAMGVNSIESLRGNRLHLRAIGLTEKEMEILGVKPAGEGA
jgi:glutamate synthase domain-containing protein 2